MTEHEGRKFSRFVMIKTIESQLDQNNVAEVGIEIAGGIETAPTSGRHRKESKDPIECSPLWPII
jgi:hypothetical protein